MLDYTPHGRKERHIIDFCHNIMSISSTLQKKAYIKSFENDEDVKEFLKWLLDKLIVTGISTKKLSKALSMSVCPEQTPYHILDIMKYLSLNSTGADKDIAVVQAYLNNVRDYLDQMNDIKILEKIITKSLRHFCHIKDDVFV